MQHSQQIYNGKVPNQLRTADNFSLEEGGSLFYHLIVEKRFVCNILQFVLLMDWARRMMS